MTIEKMMEVLNKPNVHIGDPDHVKHVIEQIIQGGPDKLQIVADFDRTLTKYIHKGHVCATCHNVLEEGSLPEVYKEKARTLRDTYFPIETNPKLSIEEKIPKMIEWWTKAHGLLETCEISRDSIKHCVSSSTAKLRDGCSWFFDELKTYEVPVLIFSAGIGDIIEEIIKQQSTMHDNMHIVSNYMKFNEEGKMTGFQNAIIHVYNKNENAIHDSDYFQNIEHRTSMILMGDSLGDLHMGDGAEVDHKLKIGFLNGRVEESLELYKKKYDIVIVEDETLDVPNNLLLSILESC
ncbi:7-methylguanosine phosphate-specific 5'-nucleotidase A-like isoform X5 [Mytilus galloprovincialis]|uniref:7-methylguanosine phosphate-specific 5'-nucleotidase A-like isoform X5 n=1 Tax=Mytilus galloprovincialis TaxID=29158 RepID=UPI003F7BF8BC